MASEPESGCTVQETLAKPFLDTVDPDDVETVDILKQKAKHKPYHAIMRILLYVWPKPRRELVAKELWLLKNLKKNASAAAILEMDQHTSLIWNNLNVETYYSYVNRHKHYVTMSFQFFNHLVIGPVKRRLFLEGFLLDDYMVEQNPTKEQIEKHDDSKYSFVETVTYAMRWNPCEGLGKYDDDAWDSGLQHHYCHNEHHPEHWGSKRMHWRYLVEAVYDMSAMELEKRFEGHVPDNKAMLLQFDSSFLKRFDQVPGFDKVPGQLDFAKRLINYMIEACNNELGYPIPSSV